MASFNITVEDSSPLFTYSPAGSWTDTPFDDALASSYSAGSYHTTSTEGATATIIFTGTGLSIFGGLRPNYGTYSISVDGRTVSSGSARSNEASFRQILGAASGLPYGTHTAVITNSNGAPIDIDWVDFETQAGRSGDDTVRESLDDTDPSLVYSPSSSWVLNSGSEFANNTLHFSKDPNASVSMNFSGDAIAVYGTMSPDHANIRMALNGDVQTVVGGSRGVISAVRPQILLYYRADLGPGQHTLTMSGESQTTTGPFIDLDFISVFATAESPTPTSTPAPGSRNPSGSAADSNTAPSSSAPPVSDGRSSTSLVVGAVLGVTAFVLVLAVVGFLFIRRRRRLGRQSTTVESSMSAVSPILPMQAEEPKVLEAGLATPRNQVFLFPPPIRKPQIARLSIAPSYYGSEYGTPGHSREGSTMSGESTAPLVTVPRLEVPQPRTVPKARFPRRPPRTSELDTNSRPARPAIRPPTMDFRNVV
ncbi:hypothetical protein NLJ89_g2558 [Agrocybe chaxingu]|uniref:Transmembrane protein n=1 Tax=Agrocybe chaxingu TaxID=84603 RepID=A0A9W8K796_9AGAR|nr:hypothetical protein NLJ89_g2558 [Agrocybe chaxingu]